MSQPELIFRQATIDDSAALLSVRPKFTPFAAQRFLDAIEKEPAISLHFAEREGVPVGSLLVWPKDTDLNPMHGVGYGITVPEPPHTVAWLDQLRVVSAERGKGLGTAIIKWGFGFARKQGYTSLEMRTERELSEYSIRQLGFIARGEIDLPEGRMGYNYAKDLLAEVAHSET